MKFSGEVPLTHEDGKRVLADAGYTLAHDGSELGLLGERIARSYRVRGRISVSIQMETHPMFLEGLSAKDRAELSKPRTTVYDSKLPMYVLQTASRGFLLVGPELRTRFEPLSGMTDLAKLEFMTRKEV